MKVSIGSDHRGTEQKKIVASAVTKAGFEPVDCGTYSTEPCDYPDIALKVAQQVAAGESQFGILICGTGIGMSIAANKVNGIRAAVCCDVESAILSRQHNNANVLCLAGSGHDAAAYTEIVTKWLETAFEGGRHARRVDKIMQLELEQPESTSRTA